MEVTLDRSETPARPQPALVYVPHPLMVATKRRVLEAQALPGESLEEYFRRCIPEAAIDDARLVWVASIGGARVPRAMWARTMPKPGMTVWLVLSVAGGKGKNPLQTVLSIGLFFAAPGIGEALSAGLGFAADASVSIFGTNFLYTKIFGGLVSIAGSMLIGRLFQPSTPTLTQASGAQSQPSPTYSITGAANRARPFDVMGLTLGRHLVALDYGAKPFTEFIGEDQYLYQVFNAGLSDVVLSNFRIGNTPIESYPDVTIQQSGADGALTLCPGNVDTLAGGNMEYLVPIQRTSSPDAIALAVDLNLQAYAVSDTGQIQGASLAYAIEYRAVGSTVWLPFVGATATIATTGRADRKPMRLTYKRDVARGQYEVRVTGQTNVAAFENNDRYNFELQYSQMRTYQPDDADYTGQKRVAVRIKASALASGQLDQLNCIASARHEAWDGSAWVLQETSNPAWIGRWFVHGKRIDGRVVFGCDRTDADLDIEAWKAFGAWCTLKNLQFNAHLDFTRSAGEVLDAILRCGRGRKTFSSGKLGVVWDAGGQPVVANFGMANIRRETFQVEYISEETPDGVALRFINPDNNWEQDEVRAPRPGVTDPANFAQMEVWGITNRDQAGREVNLAAAAYEYLRRRVTLEQDIEGVVTTAGDVVSVSHDLTQWAYSGRLVAGSSTVLTLDREVPFTVGRQHFVRIEFPNRFAVIKDVIYSAGSTDTITLASALPTATPGGVTLYAPDTDPAHPQADYKWCFEPKATPGKLMKVIGHEPRANGVRFTLSEEDDAYYAHEFAPFDYTPAGSVLTPAPTLSNVQVIEDLVRAGAGYASNITLVWDVAGVADFTVVRASMNGVPLEEKGRTYGRRFEFLVPDTGTLSWEITVFGPRGQWAPGGQVSGTLAVVGKAALPPDVPWFNIDGDTLSWGAVNAADLAGYSLRYHLGINPSWSDALPLFSGLVTESPYTLTSRPLGQVTLLVKAQDTSGNESRNAPVIVTNFGDPAVANVVETIDLRALGFPGTVTNGAISGGDLHAGADGDAGWGPDDEAPAWTFDSAPGWNPTTYKQMAYEFQITPSRSWEGASMTLASTVAGSPVSIEFRRNAPAPAWTVDSERGWGDDDAAPGWTTPDWAPWPGSVSVHYEPYDFRIITGAGAVEGVVSVLQALIDVPDRVEFVDDFALAAGGSRLPLSAPFERIKNVIVQLQAGLGGAIRIEVADKDPVLGPLVMPYNAANAGAACTVDAQIKGY